VPVRRNARATRRYLDHRGHDLYRVR
jgi:hypothetical protein